MAKVFAGCRGGWAANLPESWGDLSTAAFAYSLVMQRPFTVQHRTALLAEAVALMEDEYAQVLGVDDVARRIATSRRPLQRCFAEHSDESFRDCLTRIRMQRAAELLIESKLPVHRIAERVGYRQPAQFAKASAASTAWRRRSTAQA